MAEDPKDYSSIGPLNATAQKEGFDLTVLILLDMVAGAVAIYIIGAIANAIL